MRPRAVGSASTVSRASRGGAADAFADPVHRPPGEDHRPQHGEGAEDLPDGGEAVAEGDEGSSGPGVAEAPGNELGRRGDPFGRAFDDADDRHGCPEGGGEEDR